MTKDQHETMPKTTSLTSIDQVTLLLLQSLPGLLLGTSSLGYDELDVILLDLSITSGRSLLLVRSLEFRCAANQLPLHIPIT